MKLLLIDADAVAAAYVTRALKEAGHSVSHTGSGREGLLVAAARPFDTLIIDRRLPEVDGMTILRTLRASGLNTPILMLTSLGGLDERVEGLNAGADDYLVKPFALAELLARLNALARRCPLQAPTVKLTVGDLTLDLVSRVVTRSGRRSDLQPREFQLLEHLMRHAGEAVTRTTLLESVWRYKFDPKTNIVETHMSRLRSKLNRDGFPDLIHTVRGVGYCLRPAE